MANRELKVEILGDSRSLERALGKASDSATVFGSKFAKAGKVVGLAALGMGAAVGAGLFVTLKKGFEELADSQKVMAQTGAVIKSTGGIANVTAKDVEGLSESLSHMSGVDDEVIASGENMLLTFKNIRNEVGQGNDIFDQATGTLLDMSTALGTDMNKSAIQLGKALNDPIKGITALARVGVTFTEGQKKTIKSLVDGGKTMEAQKMILKELNSEFGGSAKAFGDTMPGQLAKLKNAFDEVAGEMAAKFLPILTKIVGWVNDHWPQIAAVFDAVGDAIVGSIGFITDSLGGITEALGTLIEKFRNAQGAAKIGVVFEGLQALGAGIMAAMADVDWAAVGQSIVDGIVTGMKNAKEIAGRLASIIDDSLGSINWSELGATLAPGLVIMVGEALVLALDPVFWAKHWELALALGLAAFSPAVGKLAGRMAAAVVAPLRGVGERMILAIAGGIDNFAPRLASAFVTAASAALRAVAGAISAFASVIDNAVEGVFKRVGVITRELMQTGLILVVISVFKSVVEKITGYASKIGDAITGLIEPVKNAALQVALAILEPFTHLPSFLGAPFRDAKTAIQKQLGIIKTDAGKTAGDVGWSIGDALGAGIPLGLAAAGHRALATARKIVADIAAVMASVAEAHSPSRLTARTVGTPMALGISRGFHEGMPRVGSEINASFQEMWAKQAVALANKISEARDKFRSAFAGLISAGLAAFDEMVGKWRPPSLVLLDKMELEEQKQSLLAGINAAGLDLQKAQEELGRLIAEGASLEDIEAANQKVLDADQRLADAKLAQVKFNLQQQAKVEQEEHDKKAERDRKELEAELKRIQNKYAAQKDLSAKEIRQMNAEIRAAFGEAGLDSKTAGEAISNNLAVGIKAAIGEVSKAINELTRLLKRRLKLRSNAEEGDLADIETWWTDLGPMLAKQIDPTPVKLAGAGLAKALFGGISEGSEGAVFALPQPTQDLSDFTIVVEAVSTAIITLKDTMAALAAEGIQHFKLLKEGLALHVPPAVAILDTLLDKLNQIREMYLGIAGAADKAGDVTGIDLSSLIGLAEGGIVRKPTLALIGEAGPEAVVPLGKSFGSMPGVGGGTVVNVTVHGSVTSERDLVTSIRNAIVAEGRRSGGNLMGGYA